MSKTQQAYFSYQMANGDQYHDSYASWNSANTSIASVQSIGNSSPGLIAAVGTGNTTIAAMYNNANLPANAGQICTPWGFLPPCPAQGAVSGQSPVTVSATPVNFQASERNLPDGTLQFSYTWQSSSGNLADIASCQVGETVFYPGTADPYIWPAPMVQSTKNPTPLYVHGDNSGPDGTTAGMGDYNQPPGSFSKPYTSAAFDATQMLQWSCPNYNDGGFNRFVSDITISRRVYFDSSANAWKYQITKSGYTNTVTLP